MDTQWVRRDLLLEMLPHLERLKEQGLTNARVGQIVGLSGPRVSYLLHQRADKFSMDKLCEIADILNLEVQISVEHIDYDED